MSELRPITIQGIDCYEKNGTAYIKLENVARGLGFTQTQTKGGVEYTSIRWETVRRYFAEIGFPNFLGKEGKPNGKDGLPEYVPENIFYRLAMKAKNATAERFQAKVADEIIPTIRKHGMYATPEMAERMLNDPDVMIRVLQELKTEREQRKTLEQKVEQDKPKVLFSDAVSTAHNSILIGDLAKLIRQNGVEVGQKRLFEMLRQDGYLISRGASRNMPSQRSMEMGLMEIKESTVASPDGHIRVTKTTKITGKGQVYFINRYLKKEKKKDAE